MNNPTLLSETSTIPANHTGLVAVVENMPAIDCEQLRSAASMALLHCLRDEHVLRGMRPKLADLTRTVIGKTVAVHEAIHADEHDYEDEQQPEHVDNQVTRPKAEQILRLEMLEWTHATLDDKFRTVIRATEGVDCLELPASSVYLFRIATMNPECDLIVELERARADKMLNRPDNHPSSVIEYSLGFSLYGNQTN